MPLPVVWWVESNQKADRLACKSSPDRLMWEAELRDMEEAYDPAGMELTAWRRPGRTTATPPPSAFRTSRFGGYKRGSTATHAEGDLRNLSELGSPGYD